MNCINYFREIKLLEVKIEQKKKQLESIKEKVNSLSGPALSDVMGKKTNTYSKLESLIPEYVDLENEIKNDLLIFEKQKAEIINSIHELDDHRFIQLLFKRYVEYKSYELIAVEMNYTYDYVRELHKKAIVAFSITHKNTQSSMI